MRTSISLFLTVLLAGCASSPPPEPVLPADVVVVPVEEGRLLGGEATWGVRVPPAVVEHVILDFKDQPDFRPSVLAATPIETTPDGGVVSYRFREVAGIAPRATCNYTVKERDGVWRFDFKMADPSLSLWAFEGSFALESARGGKATLVHQRFLMSAVVMDRDKLLADLTADARAFRKRALETYARE